MVVLQKDILTVSRGIIVHSVNRQGVMGAGLAKQLRCQWSEVYEQYRRCYRLGKLDLGSVHFVEVEYGLLVANLVGQDEYGTTGMCFTEYDAIRTGLRLVREYAEKLGEPHSVYIPYGMGCGLGGGKWETVSAIIEDVLPEAIICQKP